MTPTSCLRNGLLLLALWPLAALDAAAQARTEAWPHWLGPTQNGVAVDPGVFAGKSEIRLEKVWSRPIETGQAGLAVAGGRVFTLFSDGSDDYAIALRADTGADVWRAKLDPDLERAFLSGPTTIPAFHDGRVFTLSSRCRLRAHDAATGRELWQIDMQERFGTALPMGCGPAPFVDGGRLVLQTSGKAEQRVVALDPATGGLVWASGGAERAGYASPVAAELAGVRQLLVRHTSAAGAPGVSGIRLSDGALLWSATLPEGLSFESPQALPGDRVLLTTVNDTHLLRVTREGDAWRARPLWHSSELQSAASPPVLHGGRLFGYAGDFLVCVDPETGKGVWKERVYAGSLILLDGNLVALSASAGLLRVVEASAVGYREKARLPLFNPGAQGWAAPSYAGGRIFVRNEEEIAAVVVR